MSDIPSYLESGEIARLIPVIADSRKEQRVASVFLAALSAIPDLAEALLSSLNQRFGKRSSLNSYTEVVFKGTKLESRDRPDGLLVVDRGRSTWTALIEAKIGNATSSSEQVLRYAQIAKDNSIDAVITISNEFVVRPDHTPITIPKVLQRKVALYHWSWKFILIEAVLLQARAAIKDPDQAFLLRELVRFLSHDSIGVAGFTQMPSEWKDVTTQVQSGAILRRNADEVLAVVKAWHQEVRDLALRMSHHLAVNVEYKISRSHASDPELHLRDGCEQLADKNFLAAALVVPDTASEMSILADLKAKTIRVGMEIAAPQDKQRTSARLNWLLRQLKEANHEKLFVRIMWPTRAQDVVCSLESLRDEPEKIGSGISQTPRAFEVFLVTTDSRRFAGRKTFVEELESAVPFFYEQVGQRLQAWRPKPPKPARAPEGAEGVIGDGADDDPRPHEPGNETPENNAVAGNLHTDLLETPTFLKRS